MADDAHLHVVNAGVAVLIERTDMALQALAGVGDLATRRSAGAGAHDELVGRGRDADVHAGNVFRRVDIRRQRQLRLALQGHDAPRTGRDGVPGMVVVATLAAQTVLVVVTFTAWPGPRRLA